MASLLLPTLIATACSSAGGGAGPNPGDDAGGDGAPAPTTDGGGSCAPLSSAQLPFGGDACKALLPADFAPVGASLQSATASNVGDGEHCEYTLAYDVPASGAVGTACAHVTIAPACDFGVDRETAQGAPLFQDVQRLGDAAFFYDQDFPTYVVERGPYAITVRNQVACHGGNTVGCSPDTMDARGVALALASAVVSRL